MMTILLSVGVMDALIPVLIVIVLIGAAAGLTRGLGFLDLFGVSTFMGLGTRSGGRASFTRGLYSRVDTKLTPKLPKSKNPPKKQSGAAQVASAPTGAAQVASAPTGAAQVSKGWKFSVKYGKTEYLADKSDLRSLRGTKLLGNFMREGGPVPVLAPLRPLIRTAVATRGFTNGPLVRKLARNWYQRNIRSPVIRNSTVNPNQKATTLPRARKYIKGHLTALSTMGQQMGKRSNYRLIGGSSTDRFAIQRASGMKEVRRSRLNWIGVRHFTKTENGKITDRGFIFDPAHTLGLRRLGNTARRRRSP